MGIMEMDRTVIILIGAGVCCAVIGLALFIKLLTTKTDDKYIPICQRWSSKC